MQASDLYYWEHSRERGWAVCERTRSASVCPHCRSALYGVPRRFIDRLFGFREHRFQCESPACGWEGTLPVGANEHSAPTAGVRP